MILLDTSVFVYALGGSHPLREPAARIFAAAREGTAVASSIEVVCRAPLRARSAARSSHGRVRSYLELLGPPLSTTDDDRARAFELYARHVSVESVDALVASLCLRDDVDVLVTADRAFADVPGLPILDLGSAELPTVIPWAGLGC